MKVYDKEIYEKQESIKFTLLIVIVFLVGFFAGYLASSFTSPKEVRCKRNSSFFIITAHKRKNFHYFAHIHKLYILIHFCPSTIF